MKSFPAVKSLSLASMRTVVGGAIHTFGNDSAAFHKKAKELRLDGVTIISVGYDFSQHGGYFIKTTR